MREFHSRKKAEALATWRGACSPRLDRQPLADAADAAASIYIPPSKPKPELREKRRVLKLEDLMLAAHRHVFFSEGGREGEGRGNVKGLSRLYCTTLDCRLVEGREEGSELRSGG